MFGVGQELAVQQRDRSLAEIVREQENFKQILAALMEVVAILAIVLVTNNSIFR